MGLIASAVETQKYITNAQILMVLHNYNCGKVDINITITKKTLRFS